MVARSVRALKAPRDAEHGCRSSSLVVRDGGRSGAWRQTAGHNFRFAPTTQITCPWRHHGGNMEKRQYLLGEHFRPGLVRKGATVFWPPCEQLRHL
jgi:hypothetical protein